jgi:3-oxochol-4-en-24-oyl-CoA dehydrogenase
VDDDVVDMIRDNARAYVARESGPAHVRKVRGTMPGFDRDAWRRMAGLGWFGLGVPEELGGAGLGDTAVAALMEELGRGPTPEPVVALGLLPATVLAAAGARTELARVLSGERLVALAWQERIAQRPEDGFATRWDGKRLAGTKRFVMGAPAADAFLVAADHEGPALLLVEAAEVLVKPEPLVDGSFAGTVAIEALVGRERRIAGAALAATALGVATDRATLAVSAEMLGLMRRAFDMTVAYLKQRRQFGQPIASFQAVQFRLADLSTRIALAGASLGAALSASSANDPRSRQARISAAKARCSEVALEVCREAIQLHGAIGYTDEYDAGLLLKRALVLAAWLGTATQHRARYADLTLPETSP